MKAEFHTVQLNQIIRGVRVKILISEYLAFLAFFPPCFACVKSMPSHALFVIGCNFCRLCWVLQASVNMATSSVAELRFKFFGARNKP